MRRVMGPFSQLAVIDLITFDLRVLARDWRD